MGGLQGRYLCEFTRASDWWNHGKSRNRW